MITTPAEAIVDPLDLTIGGGERWWKVTVRTPPGWPKFARKVYRFKAFTEDQAGQMGIEQFAQDIDGHKAQPILMV